MAKNVLKSPVKRPVPVTQARKVVNVKNAGASSTVETPAVPSHSNKPLIIGIITVVVVVALVVLLFNADRFVGEAIDFKLQVSECGDGKVTGSEQCDPGLHCDGELDKPCDTGDKEGDVCSMGTIVKPQGTGICKLVPSDKCSVDCKFKSISSSQIAPEISQPKVEATKVIIKEVVKLLPVCGNNKIETGEECDDGNTKPSDGCSADCKVEVECKPLSKVCEGEYAWKRCNDVGTGYGSKITECDQDKIKVCYNGECMYKSEVPVCGNNKVEAGEECDDGNKEKDDGCSATCQIEETYVCRGQPSECLWLDLSNYPKLFVKDGKLDAYFVIGKNAPPQDDLAMTDLAGGLSGIKFQQGGAVKLDVEINDMAQDFIIIGRPENNKLAKNFVKNVIEADEGELGLGEDEAAIILGSKKVFDENNNFINQYVQMLVTGYEPEDTKAVAGILAKYEDYAEYLNSDSVYFDVSDLKEQVPEEEQVQEETTAVCNNVVVEEGEVCDGDKLGGKTCETEKGQGYTGVLSCNPDCLSFDTSQCKLLGDTDNNKCISNKELFDFINMFYDNKVDVKNVINVINNWYGKACP